MPRFTPAACRGDFPSLARTARDGRPLAYFDGPAGSQVPRQVIDAVRSTYETANANTRGRFATSRATDRLLREARGATAALLGAASWRQISFGANMTTLAFALSHALGRELVPGDEVVITEAVEDAAHGTA